MKKSTVAWLTVAVVLIFLGCILFGGVMMKLNWNFSKLSTVSYETNTHDIAESYSHISIATDTADVEFVPSNDKQTSVSCFEQRHVKHTVSVQDDTLKIELVDTRQWYEHITFVNFHTPKIVVTLPAGTYGALSVKGHTGDVQLPPQLIFDSIDIAISTGDVQLDSSAVGAVSVKTTTGHITAKDLTAASLNLTASTGRIHASGIACEGDVATRVSTGKTDLRDITCKNLHSVGTTGDLTLTNVVAKESFTLERDTGDITFDGADAAEIVAKTSTGDIEGRLLSDKVFITSTSTGRIDVPKTIVGGRCELTTSTGNICITVGDAPAK